MSSNPASASSLWILHWSPYASTFSSTKSLYFSNDFFLALLWGIFSHKYVHNLHTAVLLFPIFPISRGFHSTVIWGQWTEDKQLAQPLPPQQAHFLCLYPVILQVKFLQPTGEFHGWCPMVMTLLWNKKCRGWSIPNSYSRFGVRYCVPCSLDSTISGTGDLDCTWELWKCVISLRDFGGREGSTISCSFLSRKFLFHLVSRLFKQW